MANESAEVDAAGVKDQRVALVGRFGGMNRREAAAVVRSFGGRVASLDADAVDWVVIGAEESPLAEAELISDAVHEAAADGRLEVLHETELWQRLGLVDREHSVRRYHTPAMLAHLLDVPVNVVRRWHRRGLITPVRTLHRLPYFDFQEIATARRLAGWIAAGESPRAIEQRLVDWIEILPDIRRPLDQLSILVEGRDVLLRHGGGLLEPGGQMRFDFDSGKSVDREHSFPPADPPSILSLDDARTQTDGTADPWLETAYDAEDIGDHVLAIDTYHAILARDGPRADISFALAEVLYRTGEITAARERYSVAVELDPEHVEARASLGNVYAETGRPELAIAAYRGALSLHEDFPDVHYNLARVLDETCREREADHHWRRFLSLAPESPWAGEARRRLGESDR